MPKKSAVAVLLALGVPLAPLVSHAQAGAGVLQVAAAAQGEPRDEGRDTFQDEPQDETQDEGPAHYEPPSPQSMVRMSGGMAAMTQYCGLATRAEIEQAFASKGQPQMAKSLKLAPAEVKRIFWDTYKATMQRASQVSPEEKQKHCKDILALGGKGAAK